MRKELLLLGLLAMSGCQSDKAAYAIPPVAIHAHRGGAKLRPENSLSAFQTALGQVGVDAVELDVRPTADHVLVVHHDTNINPKICLAPGGKPVTNPPLIAHVSLADLRRYDCGTLVGLPKGTPIPTLDELFNATEALKTQTHVAPHYDIHMKWDPGTISAGDFVQLVMNSVWRHGVTDRAIILNETLNVLSAAKQLEPKIGLYFLVNVVNSTVYEIASELKVDAVAPYGDTLDGPTVQKLHQAGYKVFPWTVNSVYAWTSLSKMGVDGIITDDPTGLKELVAGHTGNQSIFAGSE
jgi:glycerophosphoryl diester phosphodiesterase